MALAVRGTSLLAVAWTLVQHADRHVVHTLVQGVAGSELSVLITIRAYLSWSSRKSTSAHQFLGEVDDHASRAVIAG
jgi:hypothetical protein